MSILIAVEGKLHYSPVENWKLIWIASLEINDSIRKKIHSKYHVDSDELLAYLVCNARVRGRTIFNLEHGQRYLIFAQVQPGKIFEVHANLVDSEYSAWSLGTTRIVARIPESER